MYRTTVLSTSFDNTMIIKGIPEAFKLISRLLRSQNMKLTAEQERIKRLLAETITLLCKNGLTFKTEFSIEALVGITLDQEDVLLLSIKETVKNSVTSPSSFSPVISNACGVADIKKSKPFACPNSKSSITSRKSCDEIVANKNRSCSIDKSDGGPIVIAPTKSNKETKTSKEDVQSEKSSKSEPCVSICTMEDGVSVKLQRSSSSRSSVSCTSSINTDITDDNKSAADLSSLGISIDTINPSNSPEDLPENMSGNSASETLPAIDKDLVADEKILGQCDLDDDDDDDDIVEIKAEAMDESVDYEDLDIAAVGFELGEKSLSREFRRNSSGSLGYRAMSRDKRSLSGQEEYKASLTPDDMVNPWTGERDLSSGSSSVGSVNGSGFVISDVVRSCYPSPRGTSQESWATPSHSGLSRRAPRASLGMSLPYSLYKLRCPYCQKGFSNSYNLRGHLVQHTGIKEHRCPVCAREYTYRQNLKLHMRHIHNIDIGK